MVRKNNFRWLPLPLVLLLTACANNNAHHLYHWGQFSNVSYVWLKEDGSQSAQDMRDILEKEVQTAATDNRQLPPGFHAHLGLLYLKLGESDKALTQWQAEKEAFPESTPFMDFQLQMLTGQAEHAKSKGSSQ